MAKKIIGIYTGTALGTLINFLEKEPIPEYRRFLVDPAKFDA
jgi:hypothetical protein